MHEKKKYLTLIRHNFYKLKIFRLYSVKNIGCAEQNKNRGEIKLKKKITVKIGKKLIKKKISIKEINSISIL